MMSPHQFAALMLRLFALWLLFTASQIALLTYALARGGQDINAPSYATALVYLVGAVVLWRYALSLARRILPCAATPVPVESVRRAEDGAAHNANGAAAVAFVGAGLLVIALKALTPIANYVSLLTMLAISGQSDRLASPALHIDGLIGLAMLLVGLTMVTRSRALARWMMSTT